MKAMMLGAAALLCGAAIAAHAADGWTPAQRISTTDSGVYYRSSGIDAAGNATVAWLGSHACQVFGCKIAQSSTRPIGGSFGAPLRMSAPVPQIADSDPTLLVADQGFATAAWSDDRGVVTANKPLGKGWTNRQYLVAGIYDFSLAGDHVGDAAMIIRGDRITQIGDKTFRKLRGGPWHSIGTPIPVTASYPISYSLVIAASGDVLYRWSTRTYQCRYRRICPPGSIVYYISRFSSAGRTWRSIAGLPGGVLAVDDSGRAALVAAEGNAITIRTQAPGGAPWSGPTIVSTTGTFQDLQLDAAGNATVLISNAALSQYATLTAPLARGPWTRQLVVDDVGPIYPTMAISASGSATIAWQDATGAVDARSRANATAPWGTRQNLADPDHGGAYVSVAAAGTGQAVVSWTRNVGLTTEIFASVHQP